MFTRDSVKLLGQLKVMLKEDQRYRANDRVFRKNIDITERQDSVHALRFIKIINTYGFPSMKRYESHQLPFSIILVHAPKVFADTLKTLLTAEKAANRITHDEYAHIIWHLNGRVGSPDFEEANTKKQ